MHTVHRKSSKQSTKMALSPKSLAGPGYIILNGIRVANVIALLAVIAGSIVMLVKTSVASKFFFFDAVSHVLTAITGSKLAPRNCTRVFADSYIVFLTASELSLFQGYYARNWPLLSPAHGFVTLALLMVVLGINMLGNLNKPATSQESLGLTFWRIVIASGIVVFIMGWINLVASFVFRNRSDGITARQVRAHGAVATSMTPKAQSYASSTASAPELARAWSSRSVSQSKTGSPLRVFHAERQDPVLPSYHTAASSPSPSVKPPYPLTTREPASPSESRYSRATACTKKKVRGMFGGAKRDSLAPPLPVNPPMEISGPLNTNKQFAWLQPQRPDSAMHPSRTGESEISRWKPVE